MASGPPLFEFCGLALTGRDERTGRSLEQVYAMTSEALFLCESCGLAGTGWMLLSNGNEALFLCESCGLVGTGRAAPRYKNAILPTTKKIETNETKKEVP